MSCRLCGTVNTICFWQAGPVKPWKRWVLLIGSVAVLLLGFSLASDLLQAPSIVGAFFALLILAMGAFGIVVSLFGCDDCVARCFGDFLGL